MRWMESEWCLYMRVHIILLDICTYLYCGVYKYTVYLNGCMKRKQVEYRCEGKVSVYVKGKREGKKAAALQRMMEKGNSGRKDESEIDL